MGKSEGIRVFMLQAAPTEWDQSDRVSGAADVPLSDAGLEQIRAIATDLAGSTLSTILCGPDEASRSAAECVAKATGARVRTMEGLAEVDLGLWEGLRREELEDKCPGAFRQWSDDPCSVTAPQGESIRAGGDRVVSALGRGIEKHRPTAHGAIGVVLRPMAHALVRCWLEGRDACDLWSLVTHTPDHAWRTIPREVVKHAREGLKAPL